jgi:hypothetical protein
MAAHRRSQYARRTTLKKASDRSHVDYRSPVLLTEKRQRSRPAPRLDRFGNRRAQLTLGCVAEKAGAQLTYEIVQRAKLGFIRRACHEPTRLPRIPFGPRYDAVRYWGEHTWYGFSPRGRSRDSSFVRRFVGLRLDAEPIAKALSEDRQLHGNIISRRRRRTQA